MNLHQWRTAKDLNMGEAATALGISQPTVSRIESGEHLPSSSTIAKLSAATDGAITAADLYEFWEAAQRQAAQ